MASAKESPMNRLFCLILVATLATLAGDLAGTTAPVRRPRGQKDGPEPFTNSTGMKFVWVAPGSFMMGSPLNEEGREQHEIRLIG
jgi:formylglycine-generating enzyme required for sulfatase activity